VQGPAGGTQILEAPTGYQVEVERLGVTMEIPFPVERVLTLGLTRDRRAAFLAEGPDGTSLLSFLLPSGDFHERVRVPLLDEWEVLDPLIIQFDSPRRQLIAVQGRKVYGVALEDGHSEIIGETDMPALAVLALAGDTILVATAAGDGVVWIERVVRGGTRGAPIRVPDWVDQPPAHGVLIQDTLWTFGRAPYLVVRWPLSQAEPDMRLVANPRMMQLLSRAYSRIAVADVWAGLGGQVWVLSLVRDRNAREGGAETAEPGEYDALLEVIVPGSGEVIATSFPGLGVSGWLGAGLAVDVRSNGQMELVHLSVVPDNRATR
jgi:hypothetical protein